MNGTARGEETVRYKVAQRGVWIGMDIRVDGRVVMYMNP